MVRSWIGTTGRFSCSDCQAAPSSNDTYAPNSVPANRRPRRAGSSRTARVKWVSGIPATIFFQERPYIYKTSDYGRSWKKIVAGIPETHFTRAVREDPARRGLLFAGTEFGAYVSFDDGGSWQSLQLNLPVVPIHDLTVKDHDLAAATHGRAFW